jgi:hypothetical protein
MIEALRKSVARTIGSISGRVRRLIGELGVSATPTLGQYHAQPARLRHEFERRLIILLIVFVGMIYGFLVAIFPVFLYLYMSMPIIAMSMLILWLLPETDKPPLKAMEWLFGAAFFSVIMWPNYLAFHVPGLPWMTLRRLCLGPMSLFLLVSISVSPTFRNHMKEVFSSSPIILRLFVALVTVEILTFPMSSHLTSTVNRLANAQFEWTATFFAGSYYFGKSGRAHKWAAQMCLMSFALSVLGVWEWHVGGIPWAGHIPSFLAIQDENLQEMLAGSARAATGIYRLRGPFTTALNFAEFLGWATPFLIYFVLESRNFWIRSAALIQIPFSFYTIMGTDSRLGFVAFFASFLLYFLLWGIRRWRANPQDVFSPAILLAYPVVATAFLVATFFWVRLTRMVWGGGANEASNEGRYEQLRRGLPKIIEWPFGHGIGESAEVLGLRNLQGDLSLDNYYLGICLEFGVIGFLVYYGLMALSAGQAAAYGVRSGNDETALLIPVAVTLVNFIIVKAVFSQIDSHAVIFMMLGMTVALIHRAKTNNVALALRT